MVYMPPGINSWLVDLTAFLVKMLSAVGRIISFIPPLYQIFLVVLIIFFIVRVVLK